MIYVIVKLPIVHLILIHCTKDFCEMMPHLLTDKQKRVRIQIVKTIAEKVKLRQYTSMRLVFNLETEKFDVRYG